MVVNNPLDIQRLIKLYENKTSNIINNEQYKTSDILMSYYWKGAHTLKLNLSSGSLHNAKLMLEIESKNKGFKWI